MPVPGLKILLDTVQPRVKRSRISLTVSGDDWYGPESNTWLVPKLDVLTCLPAPLHPSWHTSSAGNFARWGLSDFGLSAADGWTAHGTKDGVGAVRMVNRKGMALSAILGASLLANQAVFASFFAFNVGNDDRAVYFECGYDGGGDANVGVALRFWSGGRVDVRKDGFDVGTYSLGASRGTQTANRYQDLLILPMRGRELTVYSITGGDSFTHVFADVPEDEASPVVTPAEPFWFRVPTFDSAKPATVDVELAQVRWLSGWATSVECGLGRPPEAGAALEAWTNDAPFGSIGNGRLFASAFPQGGGVTGLSLRGLDGATAFAPDGAATACRMRVDLTGGTHAPFVDSAHMAYEAVVRSTVAGDDGPADVMAYLRSAELTRDDSAGPAEITMEFGWPEEMEAIVPKLLILANRPGQALVGEIVVIDGVTLAPKFRDGEHDGVRTATVVLRDRMHSLRQAALRERMPLDGLDLCKPAGGDDYGSAVEFLYRTIGVPASDLDLDDVAYRLPRVPSRDAKDFCHELAVGARPFDELEQLQQDLAPTFLFGARPTAEGVRYLFKDPDGLSTTPDAKVYRSDEDAIAAGGDPDEDVYQSYDEEPLEIEANETRAVGRDARTGRTISSFAEDLSSKDPELAPADRPDNWLGEERVMGIVSGRFARQEDCDRVVAYVHPQVSALYFVGQWTGSMLFLPDGAPLWRGHLVRLDGRRDLRVSSLRVRFVREPGDVEAEALAFREATYTGGTLTNAGGVGLAAIRAAHARRAVNKTVRRAGAELIETLTARSVVAVP